MFDKEVEAIAKCTESVKELDDDSKVRVIKYLIERFGIRANPIIYNEQTGYPNPTSVKDQVLLNSNSVKVEEIPENNNENYPSLKDLLIKNYPKTETEWILCYAFYSSNYGQDVFKRDDILDKYKENSRLSKSARANFSNNVDACVKKDWLKSINNTEYILKEEGKIYAKQIMEGKSVSKEVKQIKHRNNSNELKNNNE